MDGGLTLNVATAEKLGERNILVNGAPAPLVIRDRASAIADFIETGSFPENGSVMFVESRGNIIDLNDEQWNAYQNLREYINVLEQSPSGDVTGAYFDVRSIAEYIDDRLSDLSKALDASDPLGQYDEWRRQENVEAWFDQVESDLDAKAFEGNNFAAAEAEAVVAAEAESDWSDKLVVRDSVQTNAVDTARTAVEDQAWSDRQQTLGSDIQTVQIQAVDFARSEAENLAWSDRLETLDGDLELAQNQAVDAARLEAEDQAWSARLVSLDVDIESIKFEAVELARSAAADLAWDEALDSASAELQPLQDQAVADAKININNPVVYLLSDRDGDGIAETDGLPQTLAAGEALTAHVMVSAIDPDAAADTRGLRSLVKKV